MWPCRLAAALVAWMMAIATLSGPAFAARTLPKDAQFGKLTAFAYPYASIAGKTWRMTPGAKIYNEQNLIIMPAALRPQAKVLYRLDRSGSLTGIWVLTASEAAAYERGAAKPKSAAGTTPAGAAQ